jgi:hypothetical protein
MFAPQCVTWHNFAVIYRCLSTRRFGLGLPVPHWKGNEKKSREL